MASLKTVTFSPPTSASRLYRLLHTQQHSNFPTAGDRRNFLRLSCSSQAPPAVTKRKRSRYRKQYPGESVGITEEMRFVAMRLRNDVNSQNCESSDETEEDVGNGSSERNEEDAWKPSKEGFLKYLVDSKLVFDTIEGIVDESDDVSYVHFRKTGLERSGRLQKDLQWFIQQDLVIPEPSNPGVSYAKYLKEQAEKSAPLFLSHFYNIYFSHIAGGQAIVRQVSEKLLEGREVEFCRWEGNAEELLKGLREKLNMLAEHWTRDEKNKSLKETAKAFKYMGQIVRLIIL